MYASLALGLSIVTDRLLVFPWTGGGCSTLPVGVKATHLSLQSMDVTNKCINNQKPPMNHMYMTLNYKSTSGNKRPLTFEPLVLSHHPLKDHGDDLSYGGSGRVVGDVVLGEVKSEAQHNGLRKK